MTNILLTGSGKHEHGLFDGLKIFENLSINKLDFDQNSFKSMYQNNIDYIICLEEINPRPDNLLADLKTLKKTFSSDELKKKFYIICRPSDESKSLRELRESFLSFNDFFKNIEINEMTHKEAFVLEKVWLLSGNNCDEIRGLSTSVFKDGNTY